jgi:hypothetical protein
MIKNRKLTLEQRITRLENALKANRRGTRKFEQSYETSDFTAAETKLFCKTLNMRSDISVIKCAANFNIDDTVVIADPDGDNETYFSIHKYDDGRIEAWRDDRSRYSTSYNSIEECAKDIEPYDTSLWGDEYY